MVGQARYDSYNREVTSFALSDEGGAIYSTFINPADPIVTEALSRDRRQRRLLWTRDSTWSMGEFAIFAAVRESGFGS